ncbi:MAG: hypothetical protein HY423_04145 [Candidatus Lambdaproteobacteria bacterium]|nr:hypothetical protein [Candidatus Lambdaproteobacteria bacterium]
MTLPLILYSLWVLALLTGHLLTTPVPVGHASARPPARQAGARAEAWRTAVEEALVLYAVFAAVAVLLIALGKPGRLPQWVGWGLLAAQVLRSAAVPLGWPRARQVLGLLMVLGLAYLWIAQLPAFDPLPR